MTTWIMCARCGTHGIATESASRYASDAPEGWTTLLVWNRTKQAPCARVEVTVAVCPACDGHVKDELKKMLPHIAVA